MSTKPNAQMVCHSVNPNGFELCTFTIELHRFILPENNTHRTLSRNYQSSRAVPVEALLAQVMNNPAMPVFYGKNQRGMRADEQLEGVELQKAKDLILEMRDFCYDKVKELHDLGLHKQTANRYIEPWMWTKGVITCTKEALDAFFKLRIHPDAQPEIKALAEAMKEAYDNSTPNKLQWGEWHIPFVEDQSKYSLEDALRISASCAAQVSYRKLDDSLEKAKTVFGYLNLDSFTGEGEPPHASPVEHQAQCLQSGNGGNFGRHKGWDQLRKSMEEGFIKL